MALQPYLPGGGFLHTDDYDLQRYLPEWDPVEMRGRGVATHWSDLGWSNPHIRPVEYDGLYSSLPLKLKGFKKTDLSPIPWLPGRTEWSDKLNPPREFGHWDHPVLVYVTDPKTMTTITTQLVDVGPNLHTGAAIDLSAGAKRALGKDPSKNFYVTFSVEIIQ